MRWLAVFLWLLPATCWATTRSLVVLMHPPVPSYTADFQLSAIPPNVAEARATNAWDYSTSIDGTTTPVTLFGPNVPRWPSWTQRVPIANLGIGSWVARTNIWRDGSQTQTRTITSGAPYNVWCDSANGTASVAFTGGLVGTVTANGWPGSLTATSTTTSTTGTVTGTVTGCTMTTGASVFNPPPIVTTTGNVAAGADIPSIAIANVSGYNASAGTVVIKWYPTTFATVGTLFSFDDGTANNRIAAAVSASGNISLVTVVSSVATGNGGQTATAASLSAFNVAAISWNSTGFCYSVNGGPVTTGATTGLPTITQLDIGNRAGTLQVNGYIGRIPYYPTRMCHRVQVLSMVRN